MTEKDREWMREAVAIGEQGRITAPPNPWVGSVIVAEDRVVGRGYHLRPGTSHAEIGALREAGSAAKGATLYVTLEPCCHIGRTPPCTDAILASGIKRVVVGTLDPDPLVAGRGLAQLQKHGIEVVVGVATSLIERSLAPYLYHRRSRLPYCLGKAAISLDGRIAAKDGSSQWISCPEARAIGHSLRARSQAILVGCDTALHDSPRLTARTDPPTQRQPLRVVVDSRGRLPPSSPTLGSGSMLATTHSTSSATVERHRAMGTEVVSFPISHTGKVSLRPLLEELARRGVVQLLCEGGGKLLGVMKEEGLLQELHLFIGPRLLGCTGRPMLGDWESDSLESAPVLQLEDVNRVGQSLHLLYTLARKEA